MEKQSSRMTALQKRLMQEQKDKRDMAMAEKAYNKAYDKSREPDEPIKKACGGAVKKPMKKAKGGAVKSPKGFSGMMKGKAKPCKMY